MKQPDYNDNGWNIFLGDLVTHRARSGLGYGIVIKDSFPFRVLWPDGKLRNHKGRNLVLVNHLLEDA